MSLTSGFNQNDIHSALTSLEGAYDSLHSAVNTYVQKGFVEGMSTCWACPLAKRFFGEHFKPAFDELIKKINTNFTAINSGINSAGTYWATMNESSYTPKSLTVNTNMIGIDSIVDSIEGTQGIDKDLATSNLSKLTNFKTAADNALDAAIKAVANSGFLGGDQQSSLTNLLTTNKNIISEIVADLTAEAEKAINETVSSYGDTEGKISSAFNGQ